MSSRPVSRPPPVHLQNRGPPPARGGPPTRGGPANRGGGPGNRGAKVPTVEQIRNRQKSIIPERNETFPGVAREVPRDPAEHPAAHQARARHVLYVPPPSAPRQVPQESPKQEAVVQQPAAQPVVAAAVDSAEFRERLWSVHSGGLPNKVILSLESTFFKDVLRGDPTIKEIEIANQSAEIVRQVVEFAYRGRLANYSQVPGLRQAAVFFGMPELEKLCPEQPAGIVKTNVVEQIAKALESGDKKHQDEILAWIFAHPAEAEEVAASADIGLVAHNDPLLATSIRQVLGMKKPAA
ncbi:hypothetical protein M3Y99_01622100 [Aphelenchoides fujianensis]|nr:hypothetical protein M3Y99_01622100 [Aphelenchoides fujianensis]